MTCGILWALKLLLGEHGLRVDLEDETRGLDIGEHGTRAYASQGGSFNQGSSFIDAVSEIRQFTTVLGRLKGSEGTVGYHGLDETYAPERPTTNPSPALCTPTPNGDAGPAVERRADPMALTA